MDSIEIYFRHCLFLQFTIVGKSCFSVSRENAVFFLFFDLSFLIIQLGGIERSLKIIQRKDEHLFLSFYKYSSVYKNVYILLQKSSCHHVPNLLINKAGAQNVLLFYFVAVKMIKNLSSSVLRLLVPAYLSFLRLFYPLYPSVLAAS